MKTFLGKLLLFGCVLGRFFASGRYWAETKYRRNSSETTACDEGFRPAVHPLQQRFFAIYICGCNNGAFVEKTLDSVFAQTYDRYRLIYIDDGSTDGSFELARDYIYARIPAEQVICLRNEQRLGPLPNLIRAIDACQDDEIALILGGEDWLAHEWVLDDLNRYYADSDLWAAYTQYCEFPAYRMGNCRSYTVAETSALRQAPFLALHGQSFYASLFKRLPAEVLIDQGVFFSQTGYQAAMVSILELARGHFQFIGDVCYIANRNASVREDPSAQERELQSIRSKPPLTAQGCL